MRSTVMDAPPAPCLREARTRILEWMDLARLLEAARQGDQVAGNELVTRFQPAVAAAVHRHLQARLRPGQHALLRTLSTGDVVQEVFVEVLRNLDRWEGGSEAAFTALLTTLVEHRLLDLIRRSQAGRRDVRRQALSGADDLDVMEPDAGPRTLAMAREQVAIYRQVLAGFPERERVLLALRLEDGLEFAAIAERLGYRTADAVRKAFHGAEARLLLRLRQRGIGGTGP